MKTKLWLRKKQGRWEHTQGSHKVDYWNSKPTGMNFSLIPCGRVRQCWHTHILSVISCSSTYTICEDVSATFYYFTRKRDFYFIYLLICLQIKVTKEVWESHKLWNWTWVWTLSPKNKLTNKKHIQQRIFSRVAGTQCFSVFTLCYKNREMLQVQRKCGSLPQHALRVCLSVVIWPGVSYPFLTVPFHLRMRTKCLPSSKEDFDTVLHYIQLNFCMSTAIPFFCFLLPH